jgi:mRNA-degrading endonuclease RelE of RelBE toxin-antitoxin system
VTFDFTKGFLKRLKKLPGRVQSRTLQALDLLARDERYSGTRRK